MSDTNDVVRRELFERIEENERSKLSLAWSTNKDEQTSDWSRRPLDIDQVKYAALDAEILLELHDRLRAKEQYQNQICRRV